ncbi:MAG: malate dehydrogenase (oxaloacetate-decarboxylating)(NADP+) [Rubritalea sp.]|jgi:malate dehydrogenase (oxaloacetate-decarboxylating)(NADP+)
MHIQRTLRTQNPETLNKFYPFSKLSDHKANTLIFPNFSSVNIAYKLVGSVSNPDIIGPVLLGLNNSIHVLQMGASIRQIVDMVGIAAIQAQDNAL